MEKLDLKGIRVVAKQMAKYHALSDPKFVMGQEPDLYAEENWKYYRGQARKVVTLYFENRKND